MSEKKSAASHSSVSQATQKKIGFSLDVQFLCSAMGQGLGGVFPVLRTKRPVIGSVGI